MKRIYLALLAVLFAIAGVNAKSYYLIGQNFDGWSNSNFNHPLTQTETTNSNETHYSITVDSWPGGYFKFISREDNASYGTLLGPNNTSENEALSLNTSTSLNEKKAHLQKSVDSLAEYH